MNRLRGHSSAAGSAWQSLAVALLLLLPVGWAGGQAPDPTLAQLVQPTPGTRPLGVVLTELARQSHLSLSYSSSLVPVAHLSHLQSGPPRPLRVVLGQLLAAEHLSFGLLNGQLVLWPARVAAVHGRATPPSRLASASALAPGGAGGVAPRGAAGRQSINPYAPIPPAGRAFSAAPKHNKGAAARPEPTSANGNSGARRIASGMTATAPATPRRTLASRHSGAEARNIPPASPTKGGSGSMVKGATAKPRTGVIIAHQPGPAQSRSRRPPLHPRGNAAAQPFSTSVAHATRVSPVGPSRRQVARSRPSSGVVRGPVAVLTAMAIVPDSGLAPGRLPSLLQAPAGAARAPARSLSAEPDYSAPAVAKVPFTLARLLRPSYLHGEAWVGETLPLNAAVKVGIPRLYLVLGVAAGPPGPQSGGVAGGVGIGTVGQPRGRFTPSIDLIQWFLPGDRDTPGSQLTQLRPLLAWQTKPGGRLHIIGGPTLNLGTGFRRPMGRIRGDGELGQDQWLWVDSGDEHSFLRLWPGVQLGLRF